MIRSLGQLPYEQRLKILVIYTLLFYCQHDDPIEVFKILNKYYQEYVIKLSFIMYS